MHDGQLHACQFLQTDPKSGETYTEVRFREPLDDSLQTIMIRAKLNLTRNVEENVSILAKCFKSLLEPVKVRLEVFYAVQHSAIGSKLVCLHGIVQSDQVGNGDIAGIRNVLICGVQVDYRYWSR